MSLKLGKTFSKYNILTEKRNATIEFCQVRHAVHKHELHEFIMTRTLSKARWLFEFIDFVYQACWLIYNGYFKYHFLLSNLPNILHVAFLCPSVQFVILNLLPKHML